MGFRQNRITIVARRFAVVAYRTRSRRRRRGNGSNSLTKSVFVFPRPYLSRLVSALHAAVSAKPVYGNHRARSAPVSARVPPGRHRTPQDEARRVQLGGVCVRDGRRMLRGLSRVNELQNELAHARTIINVSRRTPSVCMMAVHNHRVVLDPKCGTRTLFQTVYGQIPSSRNGWGEGRATLCNFNGHYFF